MVIELTEEDRATTERWVRGTSTEQRSCATSPYRAGGSDEGCRI